MSTGVFELLAGSSSPLLASGDCVCFVDISDTTQAAQGSLVKGTLTAFFAAIPVPIVVTSASASAFAVGLTGATNPAFTVDASTALQVAGLKVTGAVTTGTVAIVTTDSGAATNLTINAKGAGTIGIGSVSTGRVTITPVTTITGILTITAQPILSSLTASQAVFTDGSKGLVSNAITGSGNVVMSASPTLTGTVGMAGATFSTSIISTTALATPGALSATQFTAFASTVSGAAIMGFGTTNDVSLMNRAGTVCLGVGPNTTLVNIPGTFKVATTLGVGAATPAATGSGITFPGTQSASTDVNTLDDYEEGTWTPSDVSGAGLSLTVTWATYIKIGRQVTASFNITFPATGDGTDNLIGGLPFASANNGSAGYTVALSLVGSGVALCGLVSDNLARFQFRQNPGAARTNANLSGINLRGTAVYESAT